MMVGFVCLRKCVLGSYSPVEDVWDEDSAYLEMLASEVRFE